MARGRKGCDFVVGFDELFDKFEMLGGVPNTNETITSMVRGAKIIRDDAERRIENQTIRRTGQRLKAGEALKAKPFRRQKKGNPAAFVIWDYKVSKLGHIFEFGTKKIAARPFFRPAIDFNRSQITRRLGHDLKKIIEKVATKKVVIKK